MTIFVKAIQKKFLRKIVTRKFGGKAHNFEMVVEFTISQKKAGKVVMSHNLIVLPWFLPRYYSALKY